MNPVFRFSGDRLTESAWHARSRRNARRGLLVVRGGVNAASVRVGARGVAGVCALIAAALDSRISKVSLDRIRNNWGSALDQALHRDLHAALIPGFASRWHREDIVMTVRGGIAGFHSRTFEDADASLFLKQ